MYACRTRGIQHLDTFHCLNHLHLDVSFDDSLIDKYPHEILSKHSLLSLFDTVSFIVSQKNLMLTRASVKTPTKPLNTTLTITTNILAA